MDINSDQFLTNLRSALHHLYEPEQLRRSPLVSLLGVAGRVDASAELQKILLRAIEDIRPGDAESQQSQDWRMYELLFYRYVRGYAREAVANQLGISDRQLSREQRRAIETLALHLWKIVPSEPPASDPGKDRASEQANTAWVDALPAEKAAPWKTVLRSVLDLLHALIHENDVVLHCEPGDDLPDLLVPQMALRHSLLNVLGWMIPLARKAELILKPSPLAQTLVISVQIPAQILSVEALDPEIVVARQLLEQAGGSLDLEAGPAEVRITIPALVQIPVLVIDDNPDTIQLFQRYVQGTRYSMIGLQDPAHALRVIEKTKPRILLIDVMMPELDGWDLLTQLRLKRLLQNTAVLICSILPQESLARSLGADGFLQKPVLPLDFLNALDRQMEHLPRHLHKEPEN